MNFKTYLEEGRDAPLYHGTSQWYAIPILETNILRSNGNIEKIDGKKLPGISLTRNFKFAINWHSDGIVFELDQRKLAQRYKIVPHKYITDSKLTANLTRSKEPIGPNIKITSNEYEEFVITDKISNFDKYIIKIHMIYRDYDYMINNIARSYEFSKILKHPKLFVKGKFINAR